MTRDDPGDDVPISVDNIFGNCQRNVIFTKSFQLILWQHNNLEIVTACTIIQLKGESSLIAVFV